MKSRTLGKSGIRASEIGLGCWQLGGDFGPIDDARATATMQAAMDAGITFFDTADVYGGGSSETRVGAFVKGKSGISVATKVGRSADLFPTEFDYADVRRHLVESCERLGVETLDLIQLHCIPPALLQSGEIFATMDRLVAEGLCSHWGASVETIAEAKICLAQAGCSSLQIIFNIFRQDAVTDLFPLAKAANVGIIVRLPLASGLLTGKFTADTKFDETDHRNYNADGAAFSVGETFSGIPMAKGVELLAKIKPLVPEGMSLADFALRWILDHDAVTTVIAGCSKPEQVQQNARASDLAPLSAETHKALADIYAAEIRQHIRSDI
ncbi:MAG: aldo/keto reductase [Rhodobacteraceae bacterium]|nr:aldo/keto reductase [Paracoccaceae bacterium]